MSGSEHPGRVAAVSGARAAPVDRHAADEHRAVAR
jgi:hypothetical protein